MLVIFCVDDTIIYHVYGDSHYTINTFDSDKIDSQYTKSIIQLTTDGGAGVDDGIKFQIKYFGSQYNKNVRFIFYSRVIKGKQSTSCDHTILMSVTSKIIIRFSILRIVISMVILLMV